MALAKTSLHTDEKGFCSEGDGASEIGIKATTALSIELWLEIKAQLGKKKYNPFSYKFFNLTKTLDEDCKPISIPDLLEGTSQSASELLPIPTALVSSPSVH